MILLQGTSNNVPCRVFEKSLVKHLQLGVVMLNTTETLCQKCLSANFTGKLQRSYFVDPPA